MRNDTNRDLNTSNDVRAGAATGSAAGLRRLSELDDFEVADGDPDIRGWDVKSSDGRKLGEVEELLVDLDAMRVRYIEVELDKKELNLREDRRILVPIGTARLDDEHDNVLVSQSSTDLLAAPQYDRAKFSDDYERSLHGWYGKRGGAGTAAATAALTGADRYKGDLYDDSKFFGKRRTGRENQSYLTRSEEELAVGKRTAKAGEVNVRKSVETEHVREQVPVKREEVSVERRPATASTGREASIGKDEIRVPVMEEEVVTQKRAVPKEEIIVKKHATTDSKTVEADLKKERIDVNREGQADVRDRR